jgi:hypothetical protein
MHLQLSAFSLEQRKYSCKGFDYSTEWYEAVDLAGAPFMPITSKQPFCLFSDLGMLAFVRCSSKSTCSSQLNMACCCCRFAYIALLQQQPTDTVAHGFQLLQRISSVM